MIMSKSGLTIVYTGKGKGKTTTALLLGNYVYMFVAITEKYWSGKPINSRMKMEIPYCYMLLFTKNLMINLR